MTAKPQNAPGIHVVPPDRIRNQVGGRIRLKDRIRERRRRRGRRR